MEDLQWLETRLKMLGILELLDTSRGVIAITLADSGVSIAIARQAAYLPIFDTLESRELPTGSPICGSDHHIGTTKIT